MKRAFLLMLICTLFLFCVPCAMAADLTVERDGYGMHITMENGNFAVDGKVICATYNNEGKMLAVQLATPEEAEAMTVYCDVNEVRQVRVFTLNNQLKPTAALTAETLDAPAQPIHVHTWNATPDKTVDATCTSAGEAIYYCVDNNCDDVENNGKLTVAIPPLEHQWGQWEKADEAKHTRICLRDNAHTQTLAHQWNSGTVTKEPTESDTGIMTYTCTDCKATKTETLPVVSTASIWFSYQNNAVQVNWTPVATPVVGSGYYVNGTYSYNAYTTVNNLLSGLLSGSVDSLDITVEYGTYNERTTLCTLQNAIVLGEALPETTFTVTGQANGTYQVDSPAAPSGALYSYTLNDPDGKKICSATNVTSLSMSPWEGCTLDLTMACMQIQPGDRQLVVAKTPISTISTFTYYVPSDEVQEVSTAAALKNALQSGGKAKLMCDLSGGNTITLNTGAPAVLDLNGYALTGTGFQIRNGKDLTIIGTAENSSITFHSNTALSVFAGGKLTIDGGTYGRINCTAGNESPVRGLAVRNAAVTAEGGSSTAISATNVSGVTLTNVTASAAYTVLSINNSGALTVTGGRYDCTAVSDSNVPSAISGNRCGDISITDAVINSTFNGIDLTICGDILVDGCELTSTSTKQGCTYCLSAYDAGDITINDTQAESISRVVGIQNGGVVAMRNCTLKSNYQGFIAGAALESSNSTSLTMDQVKIYAVTDAMDVSNTDSVTITHSVLSSNDQNGATSYADEAASISNVPAVAITDTAISGEGALFLSGCASTKITDCKITGLVTDRISSPVALRTTNCPALALTNTDISGSSWLSSLTSLTGGTVQNDTFTVSGECTATITDAVFTDSTIEANTGANLTVVSGEYTTDDYWVELLNTYKGTITVQGGTFRHTANDTGMFGTNLTDETLIICGGNFSQDPSPFLAAGYEIQEHEGIFTVVPEGTAPAQYTQLPTFQTIDWDTNQGLLIQMTALSAEHQQVVESITLSTKVNDGEKFTTELSPDVAACQLLPPLQYLDVQNGENTVQFTMTANPTAEAEQAGYGASSFSGTFTIMMQDQSSYDINGVTATISPVEDLYRLQIRGLTGNRTYVIFGHSQTGTDAHVVCASKKGTVEIDLPADSQYTSITVQHWNCIYCDAYGCNFRRAPYASDIPVTSK